MATTTKKTDSTGYDGVFEHAQDAGDQLAGAARKAGNAYLDSYDKTVDRAVDFELKLAGFTQQQWLRDLIQAQTDFTRQVTGSYTNSARTLLK